MSSALVLSGGGANGAYEIGVMRALLSGQSPSTRRRPLEPAAIASTSIGTFNAAVLLSNFNGGWPDAVARLERVWTERIVAESGALRNGVLRYRMNPLDWAADMRRDPLGPFRDFADDAAFLARDWYARLSGLVAGGGSIAGRFAELFDASSFMTPEPSAALVRDVVVPATRSERRNRVADAHAARLGDGGVHAERQRLGRLDAGAIGRERLQRVEVGHAGLGVLRRDRAAADVPIRDHDRLAELHAAS